MDRMASQNLTGDGTCSVNTLYKTPIQENKRTFPPMLFSGRLNEGHSQNGYQSRPHTTNAPGLPEPLGRSNQPGFPNIWQTSRPDTCSNFKIELNELKTELKEYKARTTELINAISLDLYRMKTKQNGHDQRSVVLNSTDTRLSQDIKELTLKNQVLLAENIKLKREVELLRVGLDQRQPEDVDLTVMNDPVIFADNDTRIPKLPLKFQHKVDQKSMEFISHVTNEPKEHLDSLLSGRESEWSASEEADESHYLSDPSQSSFDRDDSDDESIVCLTEDENADIANDSDEDQIDAHKNRNGTSRRIENLDWTQFHHRRRHLANDRIQMPLEELSYEHISPDGLQARGDDSAYSFVVIRPNTSMQNKTPKQMMIAAAKVFPPNTIRSVELVSRKFWKLYLHKDAMLDATLLEKLGSILDLTKWIKVVITGLPDHVTPKLLKQELDDSYHLPTASTPLAVGRRNGVYTAIIPFKNPDHAQALVNSGFVWESLKRRVRHYDPDHRSKPVLSKATTFNQLPDKKRITSRS